MLILGGGMTTTRLEVLAVTQPKTVYATAVRVLSGEPAVGMKLESSGGRSWKVLGTHLGSPDAVSEGRLGLSLEALNESGSPHEGEILTSEQSEQRTAANA